MSSYFGGYIWQLIWVLHLKTWPNSAIHFEWALIDDIDQQRLHLLSQTVLWGVYLTAYLGTSSENLNSLQNLLLLHRGLFYKRPINICTAFLFTLFYMNMSLHCIVDFLNNGTTSSVVIAYLFTVTTRVCIPYIFCNFCNYNPQKQWLCPHL